MIKLRAGGCTEERKKKLASRPSNMFADWIWTAFIREPDLGYGMEVKLQLIFYGKQLISQFHNSVRTK